MLDRILDHVRQLRNQLTRVPVLHSTQGRDPPRIRRTATSKFDDQIVPKDFAWGQVPFASSIVSPIPKATSDAQGLTGECRDAAQTVPILARFQFRQFFLTQVGLFGQPHQSAVLAKLLRQMLVDPYQIADVLGSVLQLLTRKRTVPPIRSSFFLIECLADDPLDQFSVGGRVLKPIESGGNLNIEKVWDSFSCRSVAEQNLFAARMHDHGSLGFHQQIPKRAQIVDFQWIDDRDVVFRCNLQQTKKRTIGVFRNKFRIERYQRLLLQLLAQLVEGFRRSDIKEVGAQTRTYLIRNVKKLQNATVVPSTLAIDNESQPNPVDKPAQSNTFAAMHTVSVPQAANGSDSLSKRIASPSLLVSVRSLDEADLVCSQRVDWIDLKDPDQGPLGRPELDLVRAFRDKIALGEGREFASGTSVGSNGHPPHTLRSLQYRWSIAGGELRDWDIHADQAYLEALGDSGAIKWALAQCDFDTSWESKAGELASRLPRREQAILVHYADYSAVHAPNWNATIQATRQLNLKYVLIDTAIKDGRTLMDYYAPQRLTAMIATAANWGIDVAIAGSIPLDSIPLLASVGAAWIGVRGAVCSGKSRSSPISPEKLDRAVAFVHASGTTKVSNR